MHWTCPDGREQQGLLSRPLEAPAASVGVGWTPVAEEARASFLGVDRTTSLEAFQGFGKSISSLRVRWYKHGLNSTGALGGALCYVVRAARGDAVP